ncbi:TPA: hypothetical protein N0F65_011961 [Lagenidium giganteum]|uniref:Uncharacterized protein n=1 Tax=Lagenidium giganteum TaxID=4803 RepID=A0AAV2Z995_9STRA|nr:TPA: hypothetical protein N0F65_011961 [Lagenidium giganteum]
MAEVSVASMDVTRELTVDSTELSNASTPKRSLVRDDGDEQEEKTSPDSRRSQLSIDDLSARDDEVEDDDRSVQRRGSKESVASFVGHDTKRVEEKLKLNLKQQQQHYARQRQLFEELRRDSVLGVSPSALSASSKSSNDFASISRHDRVDDSVCSSAITHSTRSKTKAFKLQLQHLQEELTDGRRRPTKVRPQSDESDDDDEDTENRVLQRRAKDIAEYHARIALGGSSSRPTGSVRFTTPSSGLKGRVDIREDASNEALRKQLELLRRLQLDNNRFRQESRSLREQNEVLEEQTTLQAKEMKRLRDEINEMTTRIQQDQLQLVAAVQNARKLKQAHKQLAALETENEKLQGSLQDALDQQQQHRLRSQSELHAIAQECKHLKRTLKQTRQKEAHVKEECSELKAVITTLEAEVGELRCQLHESQRERSDLATRLSAKTTEIESVEASANAHVERIETNLDSLQKAHTAEREKRKKVEQTRDGLKSQVATLELESQTLQDKVRELELVRLELETRLQETRQERKQLKKFQEDQVREFQERLQGDAKTIGNLRDECATFEQHLDSVKTSLVEVRKEVAVESNALRKDVEALRHYIEDAQRGPPPGALSHSGTSPASNEALLDADGSFHALQSSSATGLSRQRREELWVQLPELQFLQGAVGGLRNELMNLVNDFHRGRHVLRQQTHKLTLAQEKVVELEHLRSDDALRVQELTEQRVLAEEAREITTKEKLEILKWSQQTCERNEALERELRTSTQTMEKMRRKLRVVQDASESVERRRDKQAEDEDDVVTMASRVAKMLEREVNDVVSEWETLQDQLTTKTQENADAHDRIARLQREVENKRHEFDETVREVETLHAQSLAEKQRVFEDTRAALEEEREALNKCLEEEQSHKAALMEEKAELQALVDRYEADLPVFASLAQLFALVVPPLVLQVNELQGQKRLLLRENAEYAASQEQVECIGEVLRELVPTVPASLPPPFSEQALQERCRHVRRVFRRVVIAVFALNRFQRGGVLGATTGTGESPFGVCISLKTSTKKKKKVINGAASSGSLPWQAPQSVIKVLPPKPTLGRLDLRVVLERLRAQNLTQKVKEAFDGGFEDHSLGSVVMQVLTTLDPASKEMLTENIRGSFHCEALLERRNRRRERHRGMASERDELGGANEDASGLSTVDLIRKRILAMGKRMEDLHYQRNALQKENYELQFQLDDHARQLSTMEEVSKRAEELEQEIVMMQEQQVESQRQSEAQHEVKEEVVRSKEKELAEAQKTILRLGEELTQQEVRVQALEIEKASLHSQVETLQRVSMEEEQKLLLSRSGMDKQAEELRHLRQAAKRAHESHQRLTWQLEQELVEKANLQAMVDHLHKQKETLESEVHKAKLRGGFIEGEDSSEQDETSPPRVRRTKEFDRSGDATVGVKHEEVRFQVKETSSPHIDNSEDSVRSDSEDEDLEPHRWRAAASRSHDTFRTEWQRLDISRVFEDDSKGTAAGVLVAEVASPTAVAGFGVSEAAEPPAAVTVPAPVSSA